MSAIPATTANGFYAIGMAIYLMIPVGAMLYLRRTNQILAGWCILTALLIALAM